MMLPPPAVPLCFVSEAGGPRSYVKSLCFSPDGRKLYAAGWDKVVQVWDLNQAGQWTFNQQDLLRVPVGAGQYGELESMTVSEDGRWLATAGRGMVRELASELDAGWILPASGMSKDSQSDEGLIYLFDLQNSTTKLLRGHRGLVQALEFVRGTQPDSPVLVSMAVDRTDDARKFVPSVRIWDLETKSSIYELNEAPSSDGKSKSALPLFTEQPGITAWQHGPKNNQIRVALALGDGQFRLWDTESNTVVTHSTTPYTFTVLPVSGSAEQLLTGGDRQLGFWSVRKDPAGKLQILPEKENLNESKLFANAQVSSGTVYAGALIPSPAGKPALAAWVVINTNVKPFVHSLTITTTERPFKPIRELKLPWTGSRRPLLSVSRDGQTLALAGNAGDEIEIYSIAELIGGQGVSPQRLRSSGQVFNGVNFVRRGENWGINLQRADGAANRLVFDIEERRFESRTDLWKSAAAENPDVGEVNLSIPGRIEIGRIGVRDKSVIKLEGDDFRASAVAFCQMSRHCPVPLAAIASTFRGQPRLQLFNRESGEQVRSFLGHSQRINSLSFSDDGRMLISSADDRTVCVWTITELVKRNLGTRGMISGLSVNEVDGDLVVKSAPEKSGLKTLDVIRSGSSRGELVPFISKKDFYRHVRDHKPGSQVELTIARKDQQGQPTTIQVQCPVDQAIDAVRPLFTLFVAANPEKGNELEWIGWHPLGSFDSRGDRIENLLGWHFNTGEADRPAKFAVIGQYRNDFYHRDLLKKLIERQELPPPPPKVEEEPKVSFFLRDADGEPLSRNYQDVPQLRDRNVVVAAKVEGVAVNKIRDLQITVSNRGAE